MPKIYSAGPVAFRVRPKDLETIRQAAEIEQEHLGDFARKAAIARAQKVVKDAGRGTDAVRASD